MTTFVRTPEAARMLGVSPATLYAYVSRGRISRQTGPDGRTSLFARDEVEALAGRGRRDSSPIRPTIDVQITSGVTVIGEEQVRYRGVDLSDLVSGHSFEDIAEFLWSDQLAGDTRWPRGDAGDVARCRAATSRLMSPPGRLAVAAHVLAAHYPDDSPATGARRLLLVAPGVLGSKRSSGAYALRLVTSWRSKPSVEVVNAVDTALSLLADHELATSTLAVRIAASVRTSTYGALATGLAVIDGALHGSASAHARQLIETCAIDGTAATVRAMRERRQLIPGFGHKVYRHVDPRFPLLLEALESIGTPAQLALLRSVVVEVGLVTSLQPNIDLALGALTWMARLPPDAPIFAVARLAGWGAHIAEELSEPPVRFRGLASQPNFSR